MKTAIRFDRGTLRKPEMLPNGFMRVEGLVARVGVLEYRNDDGSIRRELRLREDVASPESLASYEGASLTDGHPTVLVDTDNVRTLEEGTATAARMDDDWVAVPMVMKSKKLIGKVRSGKTGLSAGYTIKLDETPGVHPQYGRYDAIQRDIRVNHIAVAVEVPRAGDGARIRMDDAAVEISDEESAAAARTDSQIDRPGAVAQPGGTMDPKEQIALLQTQLAEATARASKAEADTKTRTDERDAAIARAETAEGTAKDKQARLDAGSAAAEGEAVKEKQERIDELEQELAAMRKDFPVKVQERATLVNRAQAVLGDQVRVDAMDDRTILEEGVRRFEPTIKIDKQTSDAYLKTRFHSLYDSRAQSAASLKRLSAETTIVRTDARQLESDPFDPLNNGVGQWASPHATKKGA